MQWFHLWCHWYHMISLPVWLVSYGQKCHIGLQIDHLDLRNVMVPLVIFAASHDTDTNDNGITCHQWNYLMLMPMPSHDQNLHIASHFCCLNLRNAMVPLIMLLASSETDASAKWHQMTKKSNCISFGLS